MTNERNVEALALVVDVAPQELFTMGTNREWGEFLASRGVLVPRAMTDNEVMDAGQAWELNASTETLVGYLERIAKGQPLEGDRL